MKSKSLFVNESCISETLNNQVIILNIDSGEYHELNPSGSKIWEEIKATNPSRDQLISAISKRNPQAASLASDLSLFIDNLLKRKLIFEK